MSQSQLQALTELLRSSPLDLGGDVTQMRTIFHEMVSSVPLPPDVRSAATTLGGVPVQEVHTDAASESGVLLFLHGGGFCVGSAEDSVGLVSDIARRTGVSAYTVDYRLAPEHPYPAAVDDALAAYRGLLDTGVSAESVVLSGESAGGGLAMALLLRARETGLPLPAAAAVLSPLTDLTLSGHTVSTRAGLDPILTPEALSACVTRYLADAEPLSPFASPLHADLHGLPPLLIQAGTHEILLDDAVRLAAHAADDDIEVTLRTFPGAPHVFQGFSAMLDEAGIALDQVASHFRTHLDRKV